ncbi:MAG TPA: PEP/pyruvate-binding domain-containing protein [Saprospiraceae bacterium]|nr:PEP/pyruvate-binding domain-containing protein [Saprospiraceae bacterium]
MKLTQDIHQSNRETIQLLGNKGYFLIKLIKNGINVPKGFIILETAYKLFLKQSLIEPEINRLLNGLNASSNQTKISTVSKRLQRLILNPTIPLEIKHQINVSLKGLGVNTIAIRSSATVEDNNESAWAGIFDSFIGVSRHKLFLTVKKCWASLYNERALTYALNKKLNFKNFSIAIIVQELIEGDISGVGFTMSPVTKKKNQIVVESTLGRGVHLMSGNITPTLYTIDKIKSKIIEKNTKLTIKTQHLDSLKISQLASIACEIENIFNCPQDFEWTYRNNVLYILQARPITTPNKINIIPDELFNIRKNDYKIIYSSKGLPYLYEDLINNNYIKWNNLIICEKGGDVVFANKSSLIEIEKIGIKMSFIVLNKYLEEINYFFDQAEKLLLKLDKYKTISSQNIKICFDIFNNLLRLYGYFDSLYWEKLYNEILLKLRFSKKINFIQLNKNIIRDKLNNLFFVETGLFKVVLNKLSLQFSIPIKDLYWYKENEVLGLFEQNLIATKLLKSRKQCSIFYRSSNNNVFSFEGLEAQRLTKLFLGEQVQKVNILKGTVANNVGVVRGFVYKIIRDYNNSIITEKIINNMKKGQILISDTTDPELNKAIIKASALVTDIGGMLSHAAISAREFNIPCIVGVGNATEILNNGDFIEVDSKHGIIKLLV